MLKVGVVGLGRGMSHFNVFSQRKDTKVVAVCDIDENKANKVKENNGLEGAYSDYEKFLSHDLDIVVVATPLPDHASNSISALESGKHVLIEVPIANSIAECEALVKAVRKSKSKFMFAENCNYWYFVQKWKEMVDEGKIGKPIYVEAEYVHDCRSIMRDANGKLTWRASMPPIYYCTHSLGPILSVIGDRCISAVGMNTGVNVAPDLGAIDMEVGLFRTAKGAVVKVLCGFSNPRKQAFHYYSIYGSEGVIENVRGATDKGFACFKDSNGMVDLPYSYNNPNAPENAAIGGHGTAEHYMIDAFVESIKNDTKPPIDVYEGLDYSLPGLYAHLSAEQGGKILEIPDPRKM
jgi:predicted dehydrogenase